MSVDSGAPDNTASTSTAASGERKIRLRLRTTLDGQPSFVVSTPRDVTVRQLKLALEVYRGVDVTNQTLALWRGTKGYVELDDVRRLIDYRLKSGDRLFLLPILRTGPASGNGYHKSALIHVQEETNADLMKIIDEHLKRDQSRQPSPNASHVLVRRSDGSEAMEEGVPSSPSASSMASKETGVERVVITSELQTESALEKEASREQASKEKMEALKARMERVRIERESRRRTSESTSISVQNVEEKSATSVQSTETQLTARPKLVCDECGGEALSNRHGECPRCAGRFCAQHLTQRRHSCRPRLRCAVCQDLVLIAGARYQCEQCRNPLCRKHFGQPRGEHHRPASEKSSSQNPCVQQ